MSACAVEQVDKSNCLESYILIWLSENPNFVLPRCEIQEKLRSTINYQKTFDNLDECRKFIDNIKYERLVIVSNEKLGKELVLAMDQWQQISAVYIYCADGVPKGEISELKQNVSKAAIRQKFSKHDSHF
jgi:hypothetical protein